jgi:hypothetical protein
VFFCRGKRTREVVENGLDSDLKQGRINQELRCLVRNNTAETESSPGDSEEYSDEQGK